MNLAEKLDHLRALEGQLRGLGRSMSKSEVARAMQSELGQTLSVPYLSQIESGARPHLTAQSRELLARFFKVHPGYLVSDPEGFAESLGSHLSQTSAGTLAEWLAVRAEEQRADPEVYEALLQLASQPDPRSTLLAVGRALRGTQSNG
jgi:transcriptional regulator with XRE-family HTH domain